MFRLSSLTSTLLGITLIAFFVIRMAPGDPVLMMIGERGADPQQYREAIARLSLDKPLARQYLSFLARAARGDFGNSTVSGREVSTELAARWPATLELGLAALLVAMLVGIPTGVVAAIRRDTALDRLLTAGSLVGSSTPSFWLGLLLILVFSVGLNVAPVSGRLDTAFDISKVTGFMLVDTLLPSARAEYGMLAFYSALHHLVLPTLTIAAIPVAVFARMTRASMLDVLSEDYIQAAHAKGLSAVRVIGLHALRNALLPIITVVGLFFLNVAIAGAILTETIFGWPGIGSYIVSSVYARDYPVIQGSILVIGVMVVLTNGATDLLSRLANPRMR
jgi:dipeptide transport system permease protein